MNRKTLAAVWAAALLAPTAAAAQAADGRGWYGAAGYSHVDPSRKASDLGAVDIRAGYQVNRYLGAEIEGAVGVDRGRLAPTAGGSYGLDHLVGVFGMARYPMTDRFDVFARGGVAHARFESKLRSGTTIRRITDSGELWGAGGGVQFNFDERSAVRGEYMRYEGEKLGDFGVWGLSLVRRF